jgi:putative phosphoesterase
MSYNIALMSDTHMPERWHELHETLPKIFQNADLILHAGDVGELWVLDKLSAIAPVVAVHGNDEPQVAIDSLPLTQIVTINGIRILVWHSHYEDRVDEMESRRIPGMRVKLERIARYGRRVGAKIVHFGHWHIPLQCEIEGVSLINAGGIATGNYVTRQQIQTTAVLTIENDGRFHINHYNLVDGRPYHPADVIDLDFLTAAEPYFGSILTAELQEKIPHLHSNPVLYETLKGLAPQCWWGDRDVLKTADFVAALEGMGERTAETEQALRLIMS